MNIGVLVLLTYYEIRSEINHLPTSSGVLMTINETASLSVNYMHKSGVGVFGCWRGFGSTNFN
jgi:hypothetical protein